MLSLASLLVLGHLLGLALALGAATVKLALVLRARSDLGFVPAFLEARKSVTRFIVLGLALATVTGVSWLLQGYGWTPLLVVKVAAVVAMWILGPLIDSVFEPRLERLAPRAGEDATPEFQRAQRNHVAIEVVATVLMYVAFLVGTRL